jgi:FKBP-type peptidyl-prolyl cis-trans isomerase FkpA
MKHLLLVIISLCSLVNLKAQYTPAITKAGVLFYDIIPSDDTLNKRKTKMDDLVDIDYHMSIASNDSVLAETFTKNQHVTVPASHPSFSGIFKQMKKGDRVNIVISADSFYKYTINAPLPNYIKPGDSLRFYIKVHDIMNEPEFAAKEYAKELEQTLEDSIVAAKFISGYQRVKKTHTGLHYVISNPGTGKQAVAGSKVTVKYRGYLMSGKVFESNQQGFTFILGSKDVIAGWNEGIKLMREGAKFKFIIPPHLAYGGSGADIIPPFTTIVFDIDLISVE